MQEEWENKLCVLLSSEFLPPQSTSKMLLSPSSCISGMVMKTLKQFKGKILVAHLEGWAWLGSETLIWCSGRAVPNSLPGDVIGAELMIQRGTGTGKGWVSSQPVPLTPHKRSSGCRFETGASLGDGTGPLRKGRREIILSASPSLTPPPSPGQAGLCVGGMTALVSSG